MGCSSSQCRNTQRAHLSSKCITLLRFVCWLRPRLLTIERQVTEMGPQDQQPKPTAFWYHLPVNWPNLRHLSVLTHRLMHNTINEINVTRISAKVDSCISVTYSSTNTRTQNGSFNLQISMSINEAAMTIFSLHDLTVHHHIKAMNIRRRLEFICKVTRTIFSAKFSGRYCRQIKKI